MFKLLIAFGIFHFVEGLYPIVEIEDGILRGSVLRDMDGRNFFSFQGVPFAKPPIGKLRFKDPQPIEKWKGIRDAIEEPPVCLQKVFLLNDEFTGKEDCLYLNVYTPQIYPIKLKPVIIFIHGGGFAEGSGVHSYYGPEFLMSQDVVLVTLNYRLGVLGFTSFDNPALNVPGNAGLKDQVAALKWVKKNVQRFGGDPNQVTITGESVGAASVHLHVLSPLSRGLFQRAVMYSGSALGTWCLGENNNGVPTAKLLGFQGDDEFAMLELLQNANQEQLEAASINTTLMIPVHRPNRYGPTIEQNSPIAFLTDTPRNIIKNGNFNRDIQLMTGITSAEAIIFIAVRIIRDGVYIPSPTDYFIPYNFNLNPIQKAELVQLLDSFYTPEDLVSISGYIGLITDIYFTFPMYDAIFGHLRYGQDIYLYLFSSDSELNSIKNSNPVTINNEGVCHMDDLWYLFTHNETPASAYVRASVEYRSIKNSGRLLANFARYGKPTLFGDRSQWKLVSQDSINYLKIDLDRNYPGVDFYKDRVVFWCDVSEKYNLENFCPPTWKSPQQT